MARLAFVVGMVNVVFAVLAAASGSPWLWLLGVGLAVFSVWAYAYLRERGF